jgi:hypothetical protein
MKGLSIILTPIFLMFGFVSTYGSEMDVSGIGRSVASKNYGRFTSAEGFSHNGNSKYLEMTRQDSDVVVIGR